MCSMFYNFIYCVEKIAPYTNLIIAIATLVISIATCVIAYLTYRPIKGHKFSVLPVLYLNVLPGYIQEITLFNLKNKTEVICKLYAKLKDGSFLILDADTEGKLDSKIIGIMNPVMIAPYQCKKIYVRQASYFKQLTIRENAPIFNYIDIQNNITKYFAVLSDGAFLETDNLDPNINIIEFERNNTIICRCICEGVAKIKNKILLKFKLYNRFSNIDILCSDERRFSLSLEDNYSTSSIKKAISKQAKLPKNCTIELDKDIDDFLSTLKQKRIS